MEEKVYAYITSDVTDAELVELPLCASMISIDMVADNVLPRTSVSINSDERIANRVNRQSVTMVKFVCIVTTAKEPYVNISRDEICVSHVRVHPSASINGCGTNVAIVKGMLSASMIVVKIAADHVAALVFASIIFSETNASCVKAPPSANMLFIETLAPHVRPTDARDADSMS